MIEIVGDNELDRHMWLSSLLRDGIYEVTFTKVDGSARTMPCTLRPELLPEQPITETAKRPKPVKTETISAWVTDINQWRSFRVMNVIEIKSL